MKYHFVGEKERLEMLANHLKATEMDHLSHTINKTRYESMLLKLPDGDFKEKILKRYEDTCSRIEENAHIIDSIHKEEPDTVKLIEALTKKDV